MLAKRTSYVQERGSPVHGAEPVQVSHSPICLVRGPEAGQSGHMLLNMSEYRIVRVKIMAKGPFCCHCTVGWRRVDGVILGVSEAQKVGMRNRRQNISRSRRVVSKGFRTASN